MWLAGLIICLGWLISLCVHEFAHALVAYWGGDTTVKDKGYLTFNLFKYTQPGLSLILPLVFVLIGGIGLPGGAVYINQKLLRDRAWSSWVSAAGPISSALFALFLTIVYRLLSANFAHQSWVIVALPALAYLTYLEFFAVLFNLFPIPPLDGLGIIEPWLPKEINRQINKYSKYGYYFIFGLFWFVPGFGRFFSDISKSACETLGLPNIAIRYGRELFNLPINKAIAILIILVIGYALRFNEMTWYKKGRKLAAEKKDEDAIIAFNQAINIKPNYADAWIHQAHALLRLDRYEESAAAYQTAFDLEKEGELKSNFKYLAQALFNSGKKEEAITILDRSIELDPEESYCWELKAYYLYELKKYQLVIEVCRQGLETFGDHKYFNYYLAAALKQEKDAEIIISCDQAIQIRSDDINAWLNKAHALYRLNQYEEASIAYQTAFDLGTSEIFKSNLKYLIQALFNSGKEEKAIALVDTGIKLEPEENYYWKLKAFYLYKLQKYQLVIDVCRQGLETFSDNQYLYYYLAMSLKELKKYDAAQAILTQLLAIKPEYIEAISGQAHIFFLQQDYLAAINHFEKIIEIEPDYFTAWYNIACCYARQKNKHQAIASLQKAAKIDPEETAKLAKEDEDFQSLHQEPNFIKLLKAKQT